MMFAKVQDVGIQIHSNLSRKTSHRRRWRRGGADSRSRFRRQQYVANVGEKCGRAFDDRARIRVGIVGYGESDKLEEMLDAEAHAKILVEMMNIEGVERASFVGLSWGGQVVQEFAIKYPEQVEKIVLVDSLFDSSEEGLGHLAKIQAPTLIVWDEDDALIPAQWAHILAMAIRDSRLVIFTREQRDRDANPQNKHWAQMSHSLWFNKTATEFLTS